MKVYYEFLDKFEPWSGAVNTYEKINDAGKLGALDEFLDEHFRGKIVSEDDVNDLLWFEDDYVLNSLGIHDDEDDDEEDDDEENEDEEDEEDDEDETDEDGE